MTTAKANKTTRQRGTLSPGEIVRRLSALYGDPIAELVLTILSQNTSDANSGRAFMRLR